MQMGRVISYDVRVKILERKSAGAETRVIASDYDISESVVNKIWRKHLEQGKEAALQTKYSNCGRISNIDEKILTELAIIRDNNQGASYVHFKLKDKFPDLKVPSVRTLQRWWAKEGTGLPRRRPKRVEKKDGVNKPMKLGR
jgi:hypothetical protein